MLRATADGTIQFNLLLGAGLRMWEKEYNIFMQGLCALSILGRQVSILVLVTPQVQLMHAMLLVQGVTFAGVVPGGLSIH